MNRQTRNISKLRYGSKEKFKNSKMSLTMQGDLKLHMSVFCPMFFFYFTGPLSSPSNSQQNTALVLTNEAKT